MIFCSVTTNNHIGFAVMMASSIRNYYPKAKIVLCLVEENTTLLTPYMSLFDEVILAKNLGFPQFYRHIFKHSEMEGPCSCKARLMQFAFKRYPSESKYIYMDTDIMLFGDISELINALDVHPIILTPHNFIPIPLIIRHGVFNAGMFAVRKSRAARRFLRWWAKKLDTRCYLDVDKGLNADQKWLDYVPKRFGGYIFPHPGYNVGPWNLNERIITISDSGVFLVNGEPLKAFHFSSSLRHADYISFLQRCAGNVPISEATILLVKAYLNEISPLRGNYEHPWSYSYFRSGRPIELETRHKFRNRPRLFAKVKNPYLKSNTFFLRRQPSQNK
ncbi:hypothetical protein [Paenibacillus sp. YIM B09110]|uniref:hypothetical protein n=1 Tax=Paenibacillus sp. YIM B09110 TaxID=3126102 RepID=UPI00301D810B